MNSTTNLSEIQKCNYLDANLQPAKDMLLNCIGDPSKGEDKGCQSLYTKLYDPLATNLETIAIKRGVSAGYGIIRGESKEPKEPKETGTKNIFNSFDPSSSINGTVEGFTTDNGPGISVVPQGLCPQGYTWNGTNCIQVCTGCRYRDRMKSLVFPSIADQCFPEGVFDGIDNEGNTLCTCGTRHQYCSDTVIDQSSNAEGYSIENTDGSILPGASGYRELYSGYDEEYDEEDEEYEEDYGAGNGYGANGYGEPPNPYSVSR